MIDFKNEGSKTALQQFSESRERFWEMEKPKMLAMLEVFEDLPDSEKGNFVAFVDGLRNSLIFYHVLIDKLLCGEIGDVYSEDQIYTILGFDFSYLINGENADHVRGFAESRKKMIEGIMGNFEKVQFIKDISKFLSDKIKSPEMVHDCIQFFEMVPARHIRTVLSSCEEVSQKSGIDIELIIMKWEGPAERDRKRAAEERNKELPDLF